MSEMIQIPKGWKSKKIIDVCELINGRAFKPSDWTTTGLKIIRIQNLNNNSALFNHYNQEVKEKFIINTGDLLFSWSGTPGTSFGAHIWKHDKAILNQHIFKVEINSKIVDKYFLRYALNWNLEEYIKNSHGGAGLKHITKPKLENSFLPIPSISKQKQIVQKLDDILGQLEEKKKEILSIIEQNKAKIIFFEKHWTHYVVDREIEKHPQQKEWKKTTIGNEIEFAYGKNLPKSKRIEGNFSVYGSNGIVGTHHEFLVDFPSIVIGRKGTVGSVHKANAKFWPTDVSFYIKINDSKKLQLDFVYFLLLHLNLPKYRQSGPKSGLNRNDAYKIEFSLPPLSTQKQIVQNIKSAEEKFQSQKVQFENIKQNYENTINHINHMQSSILDAAFSGKLVQ
jgi:type I restriction enzyme S subunit